MRSLGRTAADRGETLLELAIATVVIALGVTAILGGLTAAVGSSTLHRSQARVRAALGTWAETVAAVGDTGGYAYTSCAGTGAFPAAPSLPSGYTSAVSSVKYWNGTAWSSTCGTDTGMQKVTLTVTAPSALLAAYTQSLDVVVRRPCAAAAGSPGAC